MGFHFNPLKAATRALGIHDKARPAINTALKVAFFPYGVTDAAVSLGQRLVPKLLGAVGSKSQAAPQGVYGQQNPLNFSYQAPSYQAPYYGGGGSVYDQPSYQPYGGQSWGSSMTFPTYSVPQYQASPVYSTQPQRPAWEDIAALALPFLL